MSKVDVTMDIDRVIVAQNKQELFMMGFYDVREDPEDNLFNKIVVPDNVFINKYGCWFNTADFDARFNCNYGGGGPGNYVRFLMKNTNLTPEYLESIIHNNEIVECDMDNEKLIVHEPQLQNRGLNFKATKDGKIVFFLQNDPHILFRGGMDKFIDQIIFTHNVIEKVADNNKDSSLKKIIYLGDMNSDKFRKYNNGLDSSSITRDVYNFIIEYENFEVWAYYPFIEKQRVVAFDEKFKEVLQRIGITLEDRFNNPINKFIDKLNYMRLSEQKNYSIDIEYDN